MEDIDVMIRTICQELYDNLRHNNSIFSGIKSRKYVKKLYKINKKNDYQYTELIRDEIGLLYKNYMVFCNRREYDNNIHCMNKIYRAYIDFCQQIENFLVGYESRTKVSEYKSLDAYIKNLDKTYGGQTQKYLHKLSKKRFGPQSKKIKNICKDKSKIISEKKREVKEILQHKLDIWNGKYKTDKDLYISYDSDSAEYTMLKIKDGKCIGRKKLKFKPNFSDIEVLQKNALKNLKQLNFNIDIYKELNLSKEKIKYVDPFIVAMLSSNGYLDYAKLYLRLVSGNSTLKKSQLPFEIKYNINKDFSKGILSPKRNEIIAIIAERSSLTVAYYNICKNINKKVKMIG